MANPGFYFDERIGNGMTQGAEPKRRREEDDPSWDDIEYETEADREAAEDRKHFEDGFPMLFG